MDAQEATPGRAVTWVPRGLKETRLCGRYADWRIERIDPPLSPHMKGERSVRLYPVENGTMVQGVTTWVPLSRVTLRRQRSDVDNT